MSKKSQLNILILLATIALLLISHHFKVLPMVGTILVGIFMLWKIIDKKNNPKT